MAQLKGNRAFSGMVGNVVFRTLNGKQIVQSRPTNVKHSASQQRSASEFGNCSRWSKLLRTGLQPLLLGMTDAYMHKRFSAEVYNILKQSDLPQGQRNLLNADMQTLTGFEFNTHSPFGHYCPIPFSATFDADNRLTTALPSFDPNTQLHFPPKCDHAQLVTYVLTTNLKNPTQDKTFHSLIEISKNTPIPSQNVLVTEPIPEGYFVLCVTKILFHKPSVITGRTYLNTKELSPAMVVFAGSVDL